MLECLAAAAWLVGGGTAAVVALLVGAFFVFKLPPPSKAQREVVQQFSRGMIAHRGAELDAPENTLAALRLCKQNGAIAAEIDVDFTADGEAVLLHDDTVNRTCHGGSGPVASFTLAALQKLDATKGHARAAQFHGETVPTFDEAVRVAKEVGLNLFVDLKSNPAKSAEAVALVFAKYDLYSHAIAASFLPHVLYAVRQRDPRIATCLIRRQHVLATRPDGSVRNKEKWKRLVAPPLDFLLDLSLHTFLPSFLGVMGIAVHKDGCSKLYARKWRDAGYGIIVWTVNDPVEQAFFKSFAPIMTDKCSSQ